MNKVINLFDSKICKCKKLRHCDLKNQVVVKEENPTDYLPSDVEPK